MSVRIEVQRSSFFKELDKEKQDKYFGIIRNKFLPSIDNIYYSLFLSDDRNNNLILEPLFELLEDLKKKALKEYEPQKFDNDLLLDIKSYSIYKFCLSNPDLFDIFITNYLPNDETPRICIQVRAYGLWIHGAEKMLEDSYNQVCKIFEPFGITIGSCIENRIDYCYHTNAITSPEKMFSDENIFKHMQTSMKSWHQSGRISCSDEALVLHKDYFALGNRKSNNVFIRIYNKALEVVEMGYKGFFFDLWYQNNLISFYDNYCLEKAYLKKDYNYIYKAKLMFYVEYGTDEEIKTKYKEALENSDSTYKDFKTLANEYMPDITIVTNVEFETKRKFYYYSDDFINQLLKTFDYRDNSLPIRRLYKIIDNRKIFVDYLTSKVLNFSEDGEYFSWWKRLRNTKLEGLKVDIKLLREYSKELDDKVVKQKLINDIATNAVYDNSLHTNFEEDASAILSNLNDNHAYMLSTYRTKKYQKEKRLKNRKKNPAHNEMQAGSDD